jgi:hypothetical protein
MAGADNACYISSVGSVALDPTYEAYLYVGSEKT